MNQQRPPGLFVRFFKWYCNPVLQESILGDLEEQFEEDLEVHGKAKANIRFAWTVLRFFRRSIIKPVYSRKKLNYLGMFKHNLLITFEDSKA